MTGFGIWHDNEYIVRRLFDGLITAVALIFFVPTTLVLASWNAIPGDGLYPLKTSLENTTLLILSGTPFVPKVSMQFTDRRLGEATALLDKKGSTVGYDLLVANAQQTQVLISNKNDTISAAQFSKNIDNYKKQIEKTKVQVASELPAQSNQIGGLGATPIPVATIPPATPVPAPVNSGAQNPAQTVVINVPETVSIQHEDPQAVLQKLNDTENKLNTIQAEVNKHAAEGNQNGNGQGGNNPGNQDRIDNSKNNK